MFELCPGCRQGDFKIFQCLFRLCPDVSLADNLARGIYGILTANLDGRGISGDHHRLGVGRVLVQTRRIQMLNVSLHKVDPSL